MLFKVGGGSMAAGGGGGTAIAAHMDYMRWRNYAASTQAARFNCLRRLSRFGVEPCTAVTADISAFRDRPQRSGQPLSVAAQAMEIAHLRGFYHWMLLEGLRVDDPMLRVPLPRQPRWMPHPIPEADLALAIDTARERIRPFFFLAAYAGLRACEIAPLRGEDLWWHTDPPLLVVRCGKGGDPGTVPIAPILAVELERLRRRGYLFPKLDGTLGPVKPWTVSHLANDHLHRLGITHTLHSLRHRFGTMVHRASRDLRQTQELMRHRSPVSSAVYTLVDRSESAGIVAMLPAPLRSVS